jgi:DNA replication protein
MSSAGYRMGCLPVRDNLDDFRGFPPGELRSTPLPDVFFSHLLPAIDDNAELRVTLHVFWVCHRRAGNLRSVALDELLADATLRRSLSAEDDWQAAVQRGLDLAARRGTLLRFLQGERSHYAPNTAANRVRVMGPSAGKKQATHRAAPLPPVPNQPTQARALYERYIGLVTPLIDAELAQAEEDYPPQWLADAFAEAVARDKRSWSYVQAILRGWAASGRR